MCLTPCTLVHIVAFSSPNSEALVQTPGFILRPCGPSRTAWRSLPHIKYAMHLIDLDLWDVCVGPFAYTSRKVHFIPLTSLDDFALIFVKRSEKKNFKIIYERHGFTYNVHHLHRFIYSFASNFYAQNCYYGLQRTRQQCLHSEQPEPLWHDSSWTVSVNAAPSSNRALHYNRV